MKKDQNKTRLKIDKQVINQLNTDSMKHVKGAVNAATNISVGNCYSSCIPTLPTAVYCNPTIIDIN